MKHPLIKVSLKSQSFHLHDVFKLS